MIKSINLIIIYPLLINLIIIFLLITPSKLNKFHPISLIFILIILTSIISLKINYIYKSWLSFILFLTIIGGLIVIFLYITRLTNNELFFLNIKIIFINFLKIIFIVILIYLIYYNLNIFFFNSNLNKSFYNYIFIWDLNNINFLYKKIYNKSTIFIIFYLYYSIIIIINICSNYKSPLRQNIF